MAAPRTVEAVAAVDCCRARVAILYALQVSVGRDREVVVQWTAPLWPEEGRRVRRNTRFRTFRARAPSSNHFRLEREQCQRPRMQRVNGSYDKVVFYVTPKAQYKNTTPRSLAKLFPVN